MTKKISGIKKVSMVAFWKITYTTFANAKPLITTFSIQPDSVLLWEKNEHYKKKLV